MERAILQRLLADLKKPANGRSRGETRADDVLGWLLPL
jgi:hypothetical protein